MLKIIKHLIYEKDSGWFEHGHSGGWSDYPGVGVVRDTDVSRFVMEHTTVFDKLFRPRKIAEAALIAENILFKVFTEDEVTKTARHSNTKKQKWYF